MANTTLSAEKVKFIDELVQLYIDNLGSYRRFLKGLHGQISDVVDPENGHPLAKLVHSVKFRLKTPKGFRDKLIRKWEKCEKEQKVFPYTKENLFEKVGDLAGYRILHLHTRQFGEINTHLIPLLQEAHRITEGPVAKTWDDETKAYYRALRVEIEDNERMYSSVHYLVQPNASKALTMEIQVRTLADEIWGEIDHKINYPYPHETVACREQIRALARVTSSCSRLVDSIMTSHDDWESKQTPDEMPAGPSDGSVEPIVSNDPASGTATVGVAAKADPKTD